MLTCRNSSVQNESPVTRLRGSHLFQFHTAPSLRDWSPPDITRGCRWVVANLPPASSRFSLPVFQRRPKSLPTPSPRYALTPAPAPRCSLPTKLSASLPAVVLSRMAGAGSGEDRAAATVPPAGAPRPPLRPSPRHLGKYCHPTTYVAVGTVSFGKDQGTFCLQNTSSCGHPSALIEPQ